MCRNAPRSILCLGQKFQLGGFEQPNGRSVLPLEADGTCTAWVPSRSIRASIRSSCSPAMCVRGMKAGKGVVGTPHPRGSGPARP